MKRIVLTLALAAAGIGLAPSTARAQFYGGPATYNPIRVAQTQVISWYRAYLNRLPNAQELNILANLLLTGNNSLYVQSVILSSNEFYLRSGATPAGFLNSLFLVTLGRQSTIQERGLFINQLQVNGRLWFTQAYLAQVQGGWAAVALRQAAWGYPTTIVPIIW